MNDLMLPLPGLSSASGKPVVVKFDGGLLSSDGGVLALREVEQRLRVIARVEAGAEGPDNPYDGHTLETVIPEIRYSDRREPCSHPRRPRLLFRCSAYQGISQASVPRSCSKIMSLKLSPRSRGALRQFMRGSGRF